MDECKPLPVAACRNAVGTRTYGLTDIARLVRGYHTISLKKRGFKMHVGGR